jgi:glutathione S-transferase
LYTLYYFPGNANLVPHMLLEEIGAPYELALVDRDNNAHASPEYLRLNPAGRIPVLIDPSLDLVLFETAAIALHLADRHPAANLAPPLGTKERATMLKWLMYLTNTLQAEELIYFYPQRLTGGDEAMAAVVKREAETRIARMIDILDAELARSRGPWLLGEQYTIVDPYLLMLARWTRMMARPARELPNLRDFLGAMTARPAVQRAFEMEKLAQPWY